MRLSQILQFKEALDRELPGHAAHRKVMKHRKAIHQLDQLPDDARESAVLIHLYPRNGEWHIVFILRATYSGVHSAQVGFPGGKRELTDQNLQETALREAKEELNIDTNLVEVLGSLSPLYVPPSNFIIYPYVSFQNSEPSFIAQEREVDEIIEYQLSALLETELLDAVIETQVNQMKVKGYLVGDKLIWGATAMIVKEFTEVANAL